MLSRAPPTLLALHVHVAGMCAHFGAPTCRCGCVVQTEDLILLWWAGFKARTHTHTH